MVAGGKQIDFQNRFPFSSSPSLSPSPSTHLGRDERDELAHALLDCLLGVLGHLRIWRQGLFHDAGDVGDGEVLVLLLRALFLGRHCRLEREGGIEKGGRVLPRVLPRGAVGETQNESGREKKKIKKKEVNLKELSFSFRFPSKLSLSTSTLSLHLLFLFVFLVFFANLTEKPIIKTPSP